MRRHHGELLACATGIGAGAIATVWLVSRATGTEEQDLVRACHWEVLDLCAITERDMEIANR